MMTLNEFIKEVNFHEHYRIYQPNRDCLIFESYYKVHSPYTFTDEGGIGLNDNYWDDNDFCDDVRLYKELDEETKTFLKRFGEYKVFSMECSGFRPSKMYKNENGELRIEWLDDDPLRPGQEYIDCFNVFII
jgi:hypothetical protein